MMDRLKDKFEIFKDFEFKVEKTKDLPQVQGQGGGGAAKIWPLTFWRDFIGNVEIYCVPKKKNSKEHKKITSKSTSGHKWFIDIFFGLAAYSLCECHHPHSILV